MKAITIRQRLGGRQPGTQVQIVQRTSGAVDDLLRVVCGREDTVALLCAERDPASCHRGWLLTPLLEARGVEVQHIE